MALCLHFLVWHLCMSGSSGPWSYGGLELFTPVIVGEGFPHTPFLRHYPVRLWVFGIPSSFRRIAVSHYCIYSSLPGTQLWVRFVLSLTFLDVCLAFSLCYSVCGSWTLFCPTFLVGGIVLPGKTGGPVTSRPFVASLLTLWLGAGRARGTRLLWRPRLSNFSWPEGC